MGGGGIKELEEDGDGALGPCNLGHHRKRGFIYLYIIDSSKRLGAATLTLH